MKDHDYLKPTLGERIMDLAGFVIMLSGAAIVAAIAVKLLRWAFN